MCFKRNDFLKKENISLSSKLNDLCEGNNSLKNKISLEKKTKRDCFERKQLFEKKICFKRKGKCS